MSNYLDINQIEELVSENRYTYQGIKHLSRCFEGNYDNSDQLPALALPGGDIGDLAVLFSASKLYGFDYDIEESIKVIEKIVGKMSRTTYKHLHDHSAERCLYLHFLSENPEIFSLNEADFTYFTKKLQKQGLISSVSFSGAPKYDEGAVIIFEGKDGVYPQYEFNSITTQFHSKIFIFHRTLVEERRKIFARQLVQSNAVSLYDNLNEEYLYEILSDVGDTHLFETILKLDPKLPIYNAVVSDTGRVKVEKAS